MSEDSTGLVDFTADSTAEVICIGDELLSGHIHDSNAAWLGAHLGEIGVRLTRTTVVGDELQVIADAVAAAVTRTKLVIITGGLGPTSDDITRDALALLLGNGMHRDPAIVELLEANARARGRELLPDSYRMADVPNGAEALINPAGSAPALRFWHEGSEVIAMPGVPAEAEACAQRHVIDGRSAGVVLTRSLHVALVGESSVAARLGDLTAQLPEGVRLAYLPAPTTVEVRLTASGSDRESVAAVLDPIVARARLALDVFPAAVDDVPLAQSVVRLLKARGETVAVAESLTGGAIASALVDVPGASAVLRGAVVAYATDLKASLLGVPEDLLAERGAVDPDVARAMASGVRERCGSTWGLGTTGVAGPDPQDGHPVGEVHIGLAGPSGLSVSSVTLNGDRERIRAAAVARALLDLRGALTSSGSPVRPSGSPTA